MTQSEHQDIETLSAYIDGEIDAAETARVEEHLATCDECTGLSDSLRSAAFAISRLEAVEPSSEESREIRQTILQAIGKRSAWFTPARLAGAMGALVLLGAGVLGLILIDQQPQRGASELAVEQSADEASARVIEHNFETPQEILAVIETDPVVVRAVSLYEVSDVGERQRTELAKTTSEGEEAEAEMSRNGLSDGATPVSTPLWGCQRKALQSKPYPTMPIAARPAVYQGEKSWLLVFVFTYSREESDGLDRIRVQLVRRTDCHLLVEQVFKP